MNKLLCIIGPTSTGKTARAIKEASQTPSIIVSADSRQVYRGLDIATGKDHPQDINIYGIDIVDPDESISVSVWYDSVVPHITKAWAEGKQVIVVGGTGLYVRAITEGIETMSVPINYALRTSLESLSTPELQAQLKDSDPRKYACMNHSDLHNPRRLIRAIEVALYKERFFVKQGTVLCKTDIQIIGLKYFDDANHRIAVEKRVRTRIGQGAIAETERLLAQYSPTIQPMSAIGYRSIIKYLNGDITEDQMIEAWVSEEIAYAKRQLTWFRKTPAIWYDVDIST